MRCSWAESSDVERHYHDAEWGVPVRDDQRLFEFLVLEGAQAGLSWSTSTISEEVVPYTPFLTLWELRPIIGWFL